MRFITYTNSMDTLSVPEWIKTERYMYCDNFVNDYMKSEHFGLLSLVKHLFCKQFTLSFLKMAARKFQAAIFYY